MYKIVTTNKFEKEYSKAIKSNKIIQKLDDIMIRLAKGEKLPIRNKDHALTGNYKGRRECHIEPDWLLIYKIDGDSIIFERTGSHSELLE